VQGTCVKYTGCWYDTVHRVADSYRPRTAFIHRRCDKALPPTMDIHCGFPYTVCEGPQRIALAPTTDISQSETDISQSETDISQSETDISQSKTDISQSTRVCAPLRCRLFTPELQWHSRGKLAYLTGRGSNNVPGRPYIYVWGVQG
jgi:hypothetical protein